MNKLQGIITGIRSSENISIVSVDVNGDVFSSIVLEGTKIPLKYKVGERVTLLFKETEVGIAKNLTGSISFRNRFWSVIRKIERSLVLTKVTMEYKSHAIDSVITTQSAVELNLQDSDQVEWLVKANEMTLMKDQ